VTPALALASALVLITLGYTLTCAAAPFGRCRKCAGYGRKAGRNGRLTRTVCRRCGGNGLRVRVGRRAYEWIAREYRDGTR
jgi:hypothetical protein